MAYTTVGGLSAIGSAPMPCAAANPVFISILDCAPAPSFNSTRADDPGADPLGSEVRCEGLADASLARSSEASTRAFAANAAAATASSARPECVGGGRFSSYSPRLSGASLVPPPPGPTSLPL